MKVADFEKLIKVMMMTTSDKEHEALVAVRKANSLLAASNKNWEDVLRGKVQVFSERSAGYQSNSFNVQHNNAKEIDGMFDILLRTVSPTSSFRDFVEDVHQYWQDRGFVTDAQYKALKRAVERANAG